MMPAICCICGKVPGINEPGDWIEFRDYAGEGETGLSHPEGLEYFCNQHLLKARDLTDLNSSEAVSRLKEIYRTND